MNKEVWSTMMESSKLNPARGRAPMLIAAVVALHGVVAGSVLLSQGCGTVRSRTEEPVAPTSANMPPSAEVERMKMSATPAPTFTPPVRSEPVARVPEQIGPSYVIEKGDSLSTVAHRYGVSPREIAEMNGIKDPNKIRIGQKIVLPAYAKATPLPRKKKAVAGTSTRKETAPVAQAGAGQYVVKSGDSLSRIASRHGTTVKALREANSLKGDALRIGQKLNLPGAAGAAPAPAPDAAPTPGGAPVVDPLPLTPSDAAVSPLAVTSAPEGTATASPAAAPTLGDVPFEYTVKAGETLDDVARIFSVLKQDLVTLNGLSSDVVKAGDRIKIPMAP